MGEQVPEKVIVEILNASKWDVNMAGEVFFEKGYASKYHAQTPCIGVNEATIRQLFSCYSHDGKRMNQEGIVKFFEDIKVDLEDPVTLLVSFRMNAQQQGEYTYEMFKTGCFACGADTINRWYKAIPDLKKQL